MFVGVFVSLANFVTIVVPLDIANALMIEMWKLYVYWKAHVRICQTCSTSRLSGALIVSNVENGSGV